MEHNIEIQTLSNIRSVKNIINKIPIDGSQINTVNHTQFLGVVIDQQSKLLFLKN